MTATAISVEMVVAGVFMWERREQRRGVDEEHAAREGEFGWLVIKLICVPFFGPREDRQAAALRRPD